MCIAMCQPVVMWPLTEKSFKGDLLSMRKYFRKTFSCILVFALLASLFTGCAPKAAAVTPTAGSDQPVEISILSAKPEISAQLEAAIKDFEAANAGITVSLIALNQQNPFEKLTSMYASGNAPTISHVEGINILKLKDKLLDLSAESWVPNAMEGTLGMGTVDGMTLGMPVTVEGFGIIYNKALCDKAVGGTFDPASIKTRSDLAALMEKLEKSGVKPIHVSPMDWSLGAHLTNVMFASQDKDSGARHAFLDSMKAGSVKLADNAVFNGWLETVDLMLRYNNIKDAPLDAQYESGPVALAGGEVGLWFMGNWSYPQLKEIDPTGEYGFIPVPISDNAADYGNMQISVGVPMNWCIDKSQNTPEQQAAAKKFLAWLVDDAKGQDYVVNQFKFIPVFKNIPLEATDPLAKSIQGYLAAGNTLEWMNNFYPADGWAQMGASMQKYVAGKADKAALISELETYWSSTK